MMPPMNGLPTEEEALDAVRTLIAYIGDSPAREGLLETPARVLRAWRKDWGRGYEEPDEPTKHLKMFDAIPPYTDGPLIVVRDLAFYSTCEHHMAPFYGVAMIAYKPANMGKIGLSKLSRILDTYSRRLQTQERIGDQVADFLEEYISPDVAVHLQATHMCMTSRGVCQHNARTQTYSRRGHFLRNPSARAELIRGDA